MGLTVFLIRVLTIALLHAQVQAKFGPQWILGTTPSFILYAETTLFLPDAPSPQKDTLLVWAGMATDAKDRVQGVAASYGGRRQICGARPGQWCVYGRMYTGVSKATAVGDDEARGGIRIQFQYNPTTGRTLQTLISQSRLLATYETASGRPNKFETALECQDQCSGIVNAHTWKNTTIRLASPDPNWGNTVTTGLSWTPEPITTFDRGQTWSIPTINIQQVTF